MLCPYNLLCNEPMIGIRFQNDLNDCFLCHAIHLRHEIAGRSFGLNGQRFLEIIFEDFSRCFCGCSCDEEGCVEIYHDYCQHTALCKMLTMRWHPSSIPCIFHLQWVNQFPPISAKRKAIVLLQNFWRKA